MALYSFIGVAVTSATVTIYGQAIWDPVEVLSQFRDPLVLSIGDGLALPGDPGDQHRRQRGRPGQRLRPPLAAPDLVPDRRLDHRRPGHPDPALEADRRPDGLHLQMAGRLFVAAGRGRRHPDRRLLSSLRRTRLDLKGLYNGDGPYWYVRGFNPLAMIALAVGIAPCVPGFLGTIGVLEVDAGLDLAVSLRLVHQLRAVGGLLCVADESRGAEPAVSER